MDKSNSSKPPAGFPWKEFIIGAGALITGVFAGFAVAKASEEEKQTQDAPIQPQPAQPSQPSGQQAASPALAPPGAEVDTFHDPVTYTLMTEPFMTKCGHTFEKSTIIDLVNRFKECPICRTQLSTNDIYPNYSLKEIIQAKKQ